MRTSFVMPRVRPFALLAALLLALSACLWPGAAAANDTPGNNGTVKIHLDDTEKEPGEVANEPHVCTFHLHFYFSDPEQSGTWEIESWPPNGDRGTTVLSGTYDTHGDGEDRQPEQGVYQLPDGHYKLFWDGDLDTQKHDKMKTFWVDCPSSQPVSSPSQSPVVASQPPSAAPSESVAPSGSPRSVPSGSVSPVGGPGESPSPSELPVGGTIGGPSGSELPIAGSGPGASPVGEVLGIVGTPAVTPPPTDTLQTAAPASDGGWRLAVLIIAGLVTALAMLIPAPKRLTGRIRKDRR